MTNSFISSVKHFWQYCPSCGSVVVIQRTVLTYQELLTGPQVHLRFDDFQIRILDPDLCPEPMAQLYLVVSLAPRTRQCKLNSGNANWTSALPDLMFLVIQWMAPPVTQNGNLRVILHTYILNPRLIGSLVLLLCCLSHPPLFLPTPISWIQAHHFSYGFLQKTYNWILVASLSLIHFHTISKISFLKQQPDWSFPCDLSKAPPVPLG